MLRYLLLCAAMLACSEPSPQTTSSGEPAPERWAALKAEIARKFPGVPTITTEELVAELESDRSPLLVDVRAAAEFAVSHLAAAIHVPAVGNLPAELRGLPKERAVVTYCSVGYRSAVAAEALAAAGFTNVRNYLGSIFEWANHGLPVFDANGKTSRVHPFNDDWGQLLRPELHGR